MADTTRFVPEHRRQTYKGKNLFKGDELRRRREEQQVEIRKQKKEENLSKRRNLTTAGHDTSMESDTDEDVAGGDDKWREELPKLIQAVHSNNVNDQLPATTQFRKLLSKERNPPIEEVISANVIPRFISFLRSPVPALQFEAAWALTNIASGTSSQTKAVVKAGAVPIFVELLESPEADVREQAVWALGNIAGDSPDLRDIVLKADALIPLINLLKDSRKISMVRNGTWTLSNFCRGKTPPPKWKHILPALPVLAKLLFSLDEEILVDACWAISYLSDGCNEQIQEVIQSGVPRRLIELLMHVSTSVQTPALRSVGNIVTGDDLQTQIMINCGALPALVNLLSSPKEGIRKEACWTISNITAGNTDQIQSVIDSGIIPPLVHLLNQSDFKTKKEACWAISNATSGGLAKPEQIRYLVAQGCIRPLCDLLSSMDNKIIQVALDALENILRVGEMDRARSTSGQNDYAYLIEECGGMEKIHNTQQNANQDIYKKAYDIIDKYFGDEEDVVDDEVAPQEAGSQFQFGGQFPGQTQQGVFNFGGN